MMICDKWWWGNVIWEVGGVNPPPVGGQIFLLVRKIYTKLGKLPGSYDGGRGIPPWVGVRYERFITLHKHFFAFGLDTREGIRTFTP